MTDRTTIHLGATPEPFLQHQTPATLTCADIASDRLNTLFPGGFPYPFTS